MDRSEATRIAAHVVRESPGSTGMAGAEGFLGRAVGEYLIDELQQLPDTASWSGSSVLNDEGTSGEIVCGLTSDAGLFVVSLEFSTPDGNAVATVKGQMRFAPFAHAEWTLVRDSEGEGFPEIGSHIRLDKRVAWQVWRNGQRSLEVIVDGNGTDLVIRDLSARFGWDW